MEHPKITKQVEEVLVGLGMAELDASAKAQLVEDLQERFNTVVLHTMIEHMDEDQKRRLEQALQNEATPEQAIEDIAAEIPGLSEQIEFALEHEYRAIKEFMGK
jgi:hypothetical protein